MKLARQKTEWLIIHQQLHFTSKEELSKTVHWVIGNGEGLPDGQLAATLPELLVGSHCNRFNTTSIGIMLIGESPTPAQLEMLYSHLTHLCLKYMLKVNRICGSSEIPFNEQQCPGPNINFKNIRLQVASRLRAAADKNSIFRRLVQ